MGAWSWKKRKAASLIGLTLDVEVATHHLFRQG
jgi:hypothetical protein